MRIAESRADIDAVLEAMTGTHPPPRRDRIMCAVLVIVFTGIAIAMHGTQPAWFSIASDVFLFVFTLALLDAALSTVTVDRTGIALQSMFRRWFVSAGEIFTIDVSPNSTGLIVTTTTDKKYGVPVRGAARVSLAKLYPDLFADPVEISTLSKEEQAHFVESSRSLIAKLLRYAALCVVIATAMTMWTPSDIWLHAFRTYVQILGWMAAGWLSVVATGYVLMRLRPTTRFIIYASTIVALFTIVFIAWRISSWT